MTSSVLPDNPQAWDSYMHGASGRRSKSFRTDSRAYDPNRHNPDHGSKLHPIRTIMVLQTPGLGGAIAEYRIGMLQRRDLETGLRCGDGIGLNRHIAEKCFTGPVYLVEADAIKEASQHIDIDDWPEGGIKIIRCLKPFPGIDSSSVRSRQ